MNTNKELRQQINDLLDKLPRGSAVNEIMKLMGKQYRKGKEETTNKRGMRIAYFPALLCRSEEEVENMAWDNTKGDHPVRYEKCKNAYAWKVTFYEDEPEKKGTNA